MPRALSKNSRKQRSTVKPKSTRFVPRMSRGADKYRLYEDSVQDVEGDIYLMERIFRKKYGRLPATLREDFAGTALLSCEWVRRDRKSRAFAIDFDPVPLAWGRENHFPKLDDDERERCTLILANVLDDDTHGVDITCAYNFSYFCFKTRPELLAYFKVARASLARRGLFIVDLYGGADSQRTLEEPRELEGFDYIWDQYSFDPISNHAVNYIHFEFPDGSELRRAFKYDWRLWSIPELRELMQEAGFRETEVYWEGTEAKTNEGNGIYRRVTAAPDDPAWVSYIVAYP